MPLACAADSSLNTSKLTRPVPDLVRRRESRPRATADPALDSLVTLGDDGVAEPPAAAAA